MIQRWSPFIATAGDPEGAPILLTCEHASNALPPNFCPDSFKRCYLYDHFGWDPGAAELTRDLSVEFGVPSVLSTFSRLFIDPNRDPSHPSLIRRHIDGEELKCNIDMSPEERAARLEIFEAYHQAIARSAETLKERHKQFLLMGVHSFTPILGHSDRRHIDIGLLHDGVHAEFAERFSEQIRRTGLRVHINKPYSGLDGLLYAAARHGQSFEVPYLVLEVRSDLILGGEGRRRIIQKALSAALRPLLRELPR